LVPAVAADKPALPAGTGWGAGSNEEKEPPPSPRTRTGLGSGVVPAQGATIDWASLLKRVFFEDVMACPCGGRRRILADVEQPAAIVAILRHLGLPTEAPPIARARDPAELGFGFE
jgi:hypothetical protein